MLTSLPGNIGDINITMGYPLKMTGVYSLIRFLLNLQRNSSVENGKTYFGYQEVIEILRHQLIFNLIDKEQIINEIIENNLIRIPSDFLCRSEILKIIFTKMVDPHQLSEYLREILSIIPVGIINDTEASPDQVMQKKLINEFIYSVMKSVNRLETIVSSPDINFRNETYIRILDKILRNQSVPFTGEPLSGVQIMGFLETRALDFRNIILLSVNEGILPSVSSSSSFIPFSIREAFDLPVINHQESIYAYHFFRLLHRAENVTFIYNSDSTGLRTGEMSRFLTQLKYEQIIEPSILNLSFDIRTPASIRDKVEKSKLHIERLKSIYVDDRSKAILSPTAINTWLNCRMRFYYRYVNGLKEPEVISPEIDHAIFGQILHRIMKRIYNDHLKSEVSAGYIDALIKDESHLMNIIDLAIAENYSSDMVRPLNGNDVIIKDILFIYLQKILNADKAFAPFAIAGLEESFSFKLPFQLKGESIEIRTGGNIDRVDHLKGKTRIVDYKTGETAEKINSVGDLFVDDRKKDLDGWLQTLLYCEAYLVENPDVIVRPSIYKVKELTTDKSSDILVIKEDKTSEIRLDDYQTVRGSFLDGLEGVISTIFSAEEPFRMTKNTNKCGYCPYKGLCQR
jgi:CRISPR/Cas system-associated exonuclease Cas4 (RecB family)